MLRAEHRRYGSIDCIVVDGSQSPRIPVVICHGYGASGSDLAGLSAEWAQIIGDTAAHFRFVFPEAPHTLEDEGMPDGHAWWPINMSGMMSLIEGNQFEQLHDQEPPGIVEATDEICRTLQAVTDELSGPSTPMVLGGFSQGAMLAMNAALRGEIAPPKLLFQFSGTMICRPRWQAELAKLKTTQVFQSHGTVDPILPYASAVTLHELMQATGIAVRFHSFPGPHTIDAESITITAQMLAELV